MAVTAPAAIRELLGAPTPGAWLEAAAGNLPVLLLDHANCELKAASTALAFLYRYPDRPQLAQRMSRLAREELRHFEQVRALMIEMEVPFAKLSASRYAGTLRDAVRPHEPARLLDQLLVGALIEARSCERFALLAPRLPGALSAFYESLLASEARHFGQYLELAETETKAGRAAIDARLCDLKALEASLVTTPDPEFRFHSGVPA